MPRTLRARHERFALSRPFRIARGVKTATDVVTVEVEERGVTGRGEGVPYPRYGESIEGSLAEIRGVRSAIEAGAGRDELLSLLTPGAARNALDCALWDLEAKLARTTVAQMIGAPSPGAQPTALTVVIDAPERMAGAAAAMADAPLIKVKVDASDPAAAIRAVRGAAPRAALIVDPNESWDEALVRAAMPVLEECRVSVLEQPCPAAADAWLEGFRYPAYHLERHGDQYELTFEGPWIETTMWEIPALAVLMELHSRAVTKGLGKFELQVLYAMAMTRVWEKIGRLKLLPGISIADFGTRRRHGFLWQAPLLAAASNEQAEICAITTTLDRDEIEQGAASQPVLD